MKKFIKTHKKQCLIGGGIFLILFIFVIVWLFIVPIFSNNKYGDRLKGIEDHKISSATIEKIKEEIKENQAVDEVSYHSEGRILKFIIKVSADMKVEDAKALGGPILENIGDDDKSYYDIELLIDSVDENGNYPIAGYKHKTVDEFDFGSGASASE